jgi:hypothetical protein
MFSLNLHSLVRTVLSLSAVVIVKFPLKIVLFLLLHLLSDFLELIALLFTSTHRLSLSHLFLLNGQFTFFDDLLL